jgi:hypothetical protein
VGSAALDGLARTTPTATTHATAAAAAAFVNLDDNETTSS